MAHRMIAVVAVLFLCGAVWADYIAERKAAEELARTGKHEEALAAFVKMAKGEASDLQKSDALEQAAQCAIRLKDYDRADELAAQIPLEPVSKTVRMKILWAQRQWKNVVEEFKDEDFAVWPDEVAAEAFQQRGMAYNYLRDGAKAEADLKAALTRRPAGPPRAEIWLALAGNYRSNLQDSEQALNAYRQAIASGTGRGGWLFLTSAVGAADILRKQGKYAEAFDALTEADVEKLSGYWRGAILVSRAEIFAAQGKKAEAVAGFNEALQVEGVPDYRLKDWQKRLDELQGTTE